MKLTLISLAVLTVLELMEWTSLGWRLRRWLSGLIGTLLFAASLTLMIVVPSLWAATVLVLSGYKFINHLRIIKNRTHTDYLYHAARRSAVWLTGMQLITVALAAYCSYQRISTLHIWHGFAVLQLIVSSILLISLLRSLYTTRVPVLAQGYTDKELPTVSVCIPARNETTDLEACLRDLTVSTYPKLEILVLDDCSQNRHTPEIIRSFAHDGVRFIAGEAPPDNWLAKNYAYDRLAQEASGEILLFCGVDARFAPDSIRVMVEGMLAKDKRMLSVVPENVAPPWPNIEMLLVQPGRYAWELGLPRRMFDRPPVLSTCWLITRDSLQAAGGFAAVRRSSQPERYLAWQTAVHHDGYSFQISSKTLGLQSRKRFDEQQATAVRTRYPQLHRRPELVALVGIIEVAVLVLPFAILLAALLTHYWTIAGIYAVLCGLLTIFYAVLVQVTYRRFLWRSLWLLPFAALYDIGLLNYSMWQYEFNEVLWKGRNVCIPVMRVYSSLPKVP